MIHSVSVPSPLRGYDVVEFPLMLVFVPLPNFGCSPMKIGTESSQSLWTSIVIGVIASCVGEVDVADAEGSGAGSPFMNELEGGVGCGFDGVIALESSSRGAHAASINRKNAWESRMRASLSAFGASRRIEVFQNFRERFRVHAIRDLLEPHA